MSTRIPTSPRKIHGGAQWPGPAAGLPELASLGPRELGEAVVDHRSSWVRRLRSDAGDYFVKTYDFPTWATRAGAVLRRPTAAWVSRAEREFTALQWLSSHGFAAPQAVAAMVWRTAGLVRRGVLVTTAWPGTPLDRLLLDLPSGERAALATALGQFVAALHRAGFRDRNLDPRNVLATRDADRWVCAKLDSPRHVLTTTGRTGDRLARADWSRLLAQLPDDVAAIAAAAGHPSRQRSASTVT